MHLTNDDIVIIKGMVAVAATILLIADMILEWETIERWSRVFRYLALLSASILISTVSVRQVKGQPTEGVQGILLGALAVVILIVIAVVLSFYERHHRKPSN